MCRCKCRLDALVFNNKQRWNKDKCRFECKKLIDKGVCDKGYAWNPSNCECECDKSCDIDELVDKLVDEFNEAVDEVKRTKITLAENENSYKCSFSNVCVALSLSIFTINIGIATYYVYSQCYLKKMFTRETTIY